MTSAINTNGINVNYPVPGVNNNSQGFRDNFSAIRTNLNTTATEITDLQNKVVVKQALDGTVINNDMANTVISNAVTRGFRASTYNLGNALSGTVLVDVSLGDIQYGTVAGNTILSFGGWGPSGTQSAIELVLGFSNAQAVVSFPTNVVNSTDYGATTLENYSSAGGYATLTVPYGVTQLDFMLSTLDCGNTIYISPLNRPRQSIQIFNRTPAPTGQQGDVQGTFAISPSQTAQPATCTATESVYEVITCDSTSGFYLDMPIVFTGVTFGGVTAGTTYYVRAVLSSTTFTISASPGTVSGPSAAVNLSTASGTMIATPIQYMYASTGTYDGTIISKTVSNTTAASNTQIVTSVASTGNLITITSTSGYAVNDPIVFTGANNTQNSFITFNLANTIQVSSTSDFTVGMPVVFSGTVWEANLSVGNTVYVKTIQPTINATSIEASGQYQIVSAGTTDFTTVGAANNDPGTTFTANGTPTGTGTANALTQFTVSSTYGGSNINLAGNTSGTAMGVTYGGVMSIYASSSRTSNIVAGTTYYVQNVASANTLTISATPDGAPIQLFDATGPTSGAQAMNATVTTNYTVTVNNTNSLVVNDSIVFTGNVFGGVTANVPYYISSIDTGNSQITISDTRYNGVAGQIKPLTTANGSMTANSIQGTNIWKRLPLNSW